MTPPASGFRVVGGASIAYAVLIVVFHAQRVASNPNVTPRGTSEWTWVITAWLSAAVLLVAGSLLLARQLAVLRAARVVAVAAALVLLAKAVWAMSEIVEELRNPVAPESTLIIVLVPLVVLPASFWAVVLLVTARRLGRYPG